MAKRTKHRRHVAEKQIIFKTTDALLADFERHLKKHGQFSSRSAFFTDCMKSFIVQMRKGDVPAYPLEFLQKKAIPPET
jgi:hypothetical protein